MLKNILKLNGAQKMSKNEQKTISGGALSISVGPKVCLCWTTPGILTGNCTELPKCITYTNASLCVVVNPNS